MSWPLVVFSVCVPVFLRLSPFISGWFVLHQLVPERRSGVQGNHSDSEHHGVCEIVRSCGESGVVFFGVEQEKFISSGALFPQHIVSLNRLQIQFLE